MSLNEAAAMGDLDLVKLLIVDGSDVNNREHGLKVPLHRAAISGHTEVAEFLLAKGADIEAGDSSAAKAGDRERADY